MLVGNGKSHRQQIDFASLIGMDRQGMGVRLQLCVVSRQEGMEKNMKATIGLTFKP